MDAETIQEIANQLGITVDEVTKEAIPALLNLKQDIIFSELLCLDVYLR